jgi:SagB-type dehydrogenase family enzyme
MKPARTSVNAPASRNFDSVLADGCYQALADSSYPEQWQTDWQDEPYRYKLYTDGSFHPLDAFPPLRFGGNLLRPAPAENGEVAAGPLRALAHWLLCCCGLTQSRNEVFRRADSHSAAAPSLAPGEIRWYRPSDIPLFRAAPSGGALFPYEVYVASVAANHSLRGLFHYDPAHHCLVGLRNDPADRAFLDATQERDWLDGCEAALIVTGRYWKNFFKYGNAAVRLTALDTGVLASQLAYMACAFQLRANLRLFFADAPIAEYLSLDVSREVPLLVGRVGWRGSERAREPQMVVANTARASEQNLLERSNMPRTPYIGRELFRYMQLDAADLGRIKRAAQQSSEAALSCATGHLNLLPPIRDELLTREIASDWWRRCSGVDLAGSKPLSLEDLSVMCAFCARRALWPDGLLELHASHVLTLYCVILRSTALAPGVFVYDTARHALVEQSSLEQRSLAVALQSAYRLQNINMSCLSAAFFASTDTRAVTRSFGNRGPRAADMLAGAVVHRLGQCAGARGFGCRIFFGFDAHRVQQILGARAPGLPLVGAAIGAPPRSGACLHMPLWS